MMKFALFLATLALVAPAARSAESFEGKVTFTMTSGAGVPNEVSYSIKGTHLLISAGNAAGIILDRDKNEVTIMMPQQRMYMVRPLPQPPAGLQSSISASKGVSLQETGATEEILGYTCKKYLLKTDSSTTELWLTDQLGSFIGLGAAMGGGRPGGRAGPAQAWEQALQGKNFFPMRVVGQNSSGAQTFRLEVTAVAKQPVDDSVFSPPDDWKKIDLGAMMGGFAPH